MSMSSTSSFVTEVLQNAGRLDKEDLHAKLSSLSKKTSELKLEVYDALHKKYEDFYPSLETAVDLTARVQTLSTEMQNVASRVEKDIQTQLNISAAEFEDLSSQLSESNALLHILSRLTKLSDALRQYSEAMENSQYTEAAASLNKVEEILSACKGPRDDEIKILQAIQQKYLLERANLESDVAKAWVEMVRWEVRRDTDKKIKNNSVNVALCIKHGENHETAATNTIQAMYDLGILDTKMQQFGDQLLKSVVDPILTCADLHMKNDQAEKTSVLSLTGKRLDKPGVIEPEKCFQNIQKVMVFLKKKVFSLEVRESESKSVQLMSILGSHIDRAFIDLVITKSLSHSIPSTSSELQQYEEVIAKTELFQSILADQSFLKKDDRTLVNFVNDVNVLFANKKCQDFLEKARGLMTSEIHNMVCVRPLLPSDLPPLGLDGTSRKRAKVEPGLKVDQGIEVEPGLGTQAMLSSSSFQLPTCYISSSIEELMKLAYSTLADATSTESTIQCRIQLFYAVRNMIMLYCDVVPTYHRESLENLPQITALYHNNCMYIAHHLLTMGHQFRPHLPEPLCRGAATFMDLVPKLRRLGTEMFLRQMASQRDTLLEYLPAAQGFVSVSEGDNYNRTEKCIKQLLHQIQRLSNVWHLVLPDSVYYKSIGTLVNTCLVEIITKITSLEDISADDASQLHSLMSIITEKAPAFYEVETNETKPQIVKMLLHKHIAKWNKFSELIWVMTAGLQEIGDRWADGAGPLAAEFNSNQVKQLIRAIFQNTDKRSKILTTIK